MKYLKRTDVNPFQTLPKIEGNTPKLILVGQHYPNTKHKDITKKKKNYRPIFLLNLNAKTSRKYQQTEFSFTLRGPYTMTK